MAKSCSVSSLSPHSMHSSKLVNWTSKVDLVLERLDKKMAAAYAAVQDKPAEDDILRKTQDLHEASESDVGQNLAASG